jgi:hypothetical protein
MIMFKGQDDDKLEIIHTSLDLGIPFDDFKQMYYYAVKDPYNFLYIDMRYDEYRRNFNELLKIEK